MNKYIITADGTPLDTFDDFSISLNYQIEDILDVTKRKTNFSKTIELPGTKNNNLFFQQIFDVNVDNINFNPSLRIPANIRIGDNQVLIGNLQLINIIIENKDIKYEVVIAGTLKDIINTFQDYYISDLDYSEYNHKRNRENISNSWTYINKLNGSNQQLETGVGYVYPYIVNGGSDDVLTNWYVYDAYPAVYVKTIMDKVFEFSDFTYSSSFFDSQYFKELIIPFSENKLQLDEEDLSGRETVVGVDGTLPERPGSPATGYKAIFGTTITFYEDPWLYNNTNNYYFPLDRDSGVIPAGGTEFKDDLNQWNGVSTYTCQNQGYYDVSFVGKLVAKWFSRDGQDIRWKGDGAVEYIYYLQKNGVTIDDSGGAGTYPTVFYTPGNTNDNSSPWYDIEGAPVFNLAAPNLWLEAGDVIRIRFGVRWPSDVKWDIDGVSTNQNKKMRLRMTLAESLDGSPTVLSVIPSSSQSYGGEDINMNQVVPKIKIKDFFLNIAKMFNLIIQDNPNKVNDLIIEPRDDFFQSRQEVKDWSPILDNDEEFIITPMSDLDANSYLYKYKKDGDYFNTSYLSETGKEYGEIRVDVLNDFSQKTQKQELIFSPTPDSSMFIADRVAPFFCDINENELKAKKVNHRILFYKGLIPCETLYLKDDEFSTTQITTMTSYPYCGMYDNPTNATEDLGFGRTDLLYWDTTIFPVNNLYEKYHKSTLEAITDINSRLLEANFKLTPKDIANFDFRDIIFLNGSYWRVNKIQGYNPVGNDKTTKVILYKLNNVELFTNDSVSVPTSNGSCPTDLQTRRDKVGVVVFSQSGQEVTSDCCSALGGNFFNGRCVLRPYGPISEVHQVKDVRKGGVINDKYKYTSIGVIPVTVKSGPIDKQHNQNSYNSAGVTVIGKQNYVNERVDGGALVVGNNNSVLTNNTIVLGDGITATESNTVYIGNIGINEDGDIINGRQWILEGGLDEVIRINRTNLIEIVDGGLDSVRLSGGDSKQRPIIFNADIDTQIGE